MIRRPPFGRAMLHWPDYLKISGVVLCSSCQELATTVGLWLPARGPELCPGQCWLPGEPLVEGRVPYLDTASCAWEQAPSGSRVAVCYLQAPLRMFTKLVLVKGWEPGISCWFVIGSILFKKKKNVCFKNFCYSLLFFSGSFQAKLSSGQQTAQYCLSLILK